MAAGQLLSLPAVSAGVAPSSSATAWAFGSPVTLSGSLSTPIDIIGLTFERVSNPGLDNTVSILFEVTVDTVTKLQVPFSFRADTTVGYYQSYGTFYFPEGYTVPQLAALAIRVTDSVATARNYGGVKLLYKEGALPYIYPSPKFIGTSIHRAASR